MQPCALCASPWRADTPDPCPVLARAACALTQSLLGRANTPEVGRAARRVLCAHLVHSAEYRELAATQWRHLARSSYRQLGVPDMLALPTRTA